MSADGGRPSIPTEQLLKARLLIVLYSVHLDRQFRERLSWNLLHRWFLGTAEQTLECNRSDLLILDAADPEAGPVATVRLPFRIFGQVHGAWVSAEALP